MSRERHTPDGHNPVFGPLMSLARCEARGLQRTVPILDMAAAAHQLQVALVPRHNDSAVSATVNSGHLGSRSGQFKVESCMIPVISACNGGRRHTVSQFGGAGRLIRI